MLDFAAEGAEFDGQQRAKVRDLNDAGRISMPDMATETGEPACAGNSYL
jgi:hypothetical protein